MTARETIDEVASGAAADALDALSSFLSDENPLTAGIQQHLEAVALIGMSVDPVTPPSSVKARILDSLSKAETRRPPSIEVTEASQGWASHPLPGIRVKRLSQEKSTGAVTILMEMAPGARYPAHEHCGRETCFVAEGEFTIGEVPHRRGDFIDASAGTRDREIYTQNGATLLLVLAAEDWPS